MLTDDEIRSNIATVRARIRAAAGSGTNARHVDLLLATKTMPADRVAVAVAAGERLVGENRVQELAEKDAVLSALPCERHFIGHLQTNKINQVLRYVTCIQSVDRVELADRLQRRLEALDQTVRILVQVNVSGEASKYGVSPEETLSLTRELAKRDRLRIDGLMTIGRNSSDPAAVRPGYQLLRTLRDRIKDAAIDDVRMATLSMGMSADLDIAIAEGATMVRVGSAVFGARPRS
jgi:pyridoxal phosphate enzyme (YggS family)